MSRTFAIGDIHGCSRAIISLLEVMPAHPQDTIVLLGDYVDRGVDSKGVLDRLLVLQDQCNLVPLLGNHDQMMLEARGGGSALETWLTNGGKSTLDSYGPSGRLDAIPTEHFEFLASCERYFETATHIFLHANFEPPVPLRSQDEQTIRWLSLRDYVPDEPHCSGKTVVLGHTPQNEVLDLGYLVCIDTGAASGGWLTARDVETGEVWQVDHRGTPRDYRGAP